MNININNNNVDVDNNNIQLTVEENNKLLKVLEDLKYISNNRDDVIQEIEDSMKDNNYGDDISSFEEAFPDLNPEY